MWCSRICRWAPLKKNGNTSPYLKALPESFELPVAHAEGRFVGETGDAEKYVKDGRAALLYGQDVNGSSSQIAGLQDDTGRVFGLMPHPEHAVEAGFGVRSADGPRAGTDGLRFFTSVLTSTLAA